ncbi:probable FAD/FMN-containing dehydrogenases [Cephalotrichum gorgonifer]|uniref:Probable FAD/FMN-containing dehydrogenases n=1 Tax=Cephalotrichum gorgonifer TaxID=2041049 RepID=A0AAE8SV56_9PEZI|nr:probable FAD/FMN-containing dehydrogenases [Cephalotrichum gorgonifer]
MASLARTLLLAGALPLASLVSAQTLVVDGVEIPANEKTVAPAGEIIDDLVLPEEFQLTDDALANLTALQLSEIELFGFGDESSAKRAASGDCKTYPGDALWPSKLVWKVFNLLTGGALIETVPIGAVCYKTSGHYDAAACENLLATWTDGKTHSDHPTSVMSSLYQGMTCLPQKATDDGICEIGGYPVYTVKATTVSQIQLAINFARTLNLRLVVHNTGHDFLGKSTGYGSLSIWTHNLKTIKYIEKVVTPSYTGKAFKIGAGVQVGELYAAAHKQGLTAIGGECKDVGVTGGYTQGGGHSPLSGVHGLGADQVLSIDVVLPNGRFVTADEKQNKDLFWALRGGGGGTFGVVTSMTVKAHPKTRFAGVTWAASFSANQTELFWQGVEAYWRHFPEYAALGTYGYSTIFSMGEAGSTWTMNPWTVPGYTLDQFKAMSAPLFAQWKAMGFEVNPTYFEHDNFYDTWSNHFPTETVGNFNLHTASRLFPGKNWESEETLNNTIAALKAVGQAGSAIIQYNMNPAKPAGTPDSAANPAWRDAIMFGIFGGMWFDGMTKEEIGAFNNKITHEWMESLRQVTPGGGGYGNEGDVMEPDFAQAFYGSGYDRLLSIKNAVDPWSTFWAPTAVGSEGWYITGQETWLTTQTGKLCRK